MSNWISTDEKLPQYEGRYLVYEKVIAVSMQKVARFTGSYFFTTGTVTHWMPLPPPPIGVPHDI